LINFEALGEIEKVAKNHLLRLHIRFYGVELLGDNLSTLRDSYRKGETEDAKSAGSAACSDVDDSGGRMPTGPTVPGCLVAAGM
jgi:hypothetical protein